MKYPRRTTLCFMIIVIYSSQVTKTLNSESIVHPLVSKFTSAIFFPVTFFLISWECHRRKLHKKFLRVFEKMLQKRAGNGKHKRILVYLLGHSLSETKGTSPRLPPLTTLLPPGLRLYSMKLTTMTLRKILKIEKDRCSQRIHFNLSIRQEHISKGVNRVGNNRLI